MNYNIDLFLKNINRQSKEEWSNYERSLQFLIDHNEGKKYLILFELIQRTCILSILQKSIKNEDQKTISYIGARIFNDGAVAFRSCMNGYYQISMSLIRDLIEIQFLLDYFRSDRNQIGVWRKSNNSERYKNFSPKNLYEKLDKKDGWTEEKRKKTYQMFCENAAHVTYSGIKLTTNDKGIVLVGSFYDEKKLLNTVLELDRRLGHAVMSTVALLLNTEIVAIQSQLDLMEQFSDVFNLTITNNPHYQEARKLIKVLLDKKNHK